MRRLREFGISKPLFLILFMLFAAAPLGAQTGLYSPPKDYLGDVG